MNSYQELQQTPVEGWKTWENASIFSCMHFPQQLGFRLGLRDYQQERGAFSAPLGFIALEHNDLFQNG